MEPITRKEKFLAKAGGQEVSLPEPITREEMFLAAIGGESGGCGRVERKEVTVESKADESTWLEGFPAFAVGDTVTVKVDGVEYSLVAFDDGVPVVGDSNEAYDSGNIKYGWCVACFPEDGTVDFYGINSHTVSYVCEVVHKIDEKFIPNYGALVMNLNELIGKEQFVCALSNGAVVRSVSPDISFGILPELSMCNFGNIGFAEKGSWSSTYVEFADTRIASGNASTVVLVYSDNIEQGIADYKSDYGIE